ncbi:hypothetical protein, partial [uncultured Enterococcus sp.]
PHRNKESSNLLKGAFPMSWLTFVVQPLTLLFFLTVFSLVYLMPESVVPKPKMKKWALTVSLIYLAWQLLIPFFFFVL